jgi:hypothetical protein
MATDRNEDIAVVGSPSTNTELTLDLLQEATEERLVGALTAFSATQNGASITSVGQIVGIELKNRWHEDSVFRNLLKRTGEIPPITNRQDTRTADLVVGATFRQSTEGYEPEVLGMVPPTGTRVSRVDQPLLDRLLSVYQEEIVYLGRAYANDVLYPMWFKHFGSGNGGAGEAYHIGVFGKTGSGKSGLAKMMLAAYSRHPGMGLLVIDPQGEFSLEFAGTRVGQQGLELDTIMRNQGRSIHRFSIGEIQLDDWETFEEMLVSLRFFEQLSIPSSSVDNSRKAAEVVRNALEEHHNLNSLGTVEVLRVALNAVNNQQNANFIYTTAARSKQLQERVQRFLNEPERFNRLLNDSWMPICGLFTSGEGRRRLYNYAPAEHQNDSNRGIINMLMGQGGQRPVVVIDISRQGNARFWTERLQRRILAKLLNVLVAQATTSLSTRESANILVVLDEAHRHAPSGKLEDEDVERLRSLLRRAIRETRKYGLGWFFISQTLGGLDNEILQQLRVLAFGFGLAMGSEFDRLKDFVGGDKRSLELYQSFRDPQSFPRRDLQEFPFMAVGPVSPLAFSGKPLFFSAFTDPEEFIAENGFNAPVRRDSA